MLRLQSCDCTHQGSAAAASGLQGYTFPHVERTFFMSVDYAVPSVWISWPPDNSVVPHMTPMEYRVQTSNFDLQTQGFHHSASATDRSPELTISVSTSSCATRV